MAILGKVAARIETARQNQGQDSVLCLACGRRHVPLQYTYDAFDQLIGRTLSIQLEGAHTFDSTEVYVHENGQIVLHYECATGSASAEDLAHRYLVKILGTRTNIDTLEKIR